MRQGIRVKVTITATIIRKDGTEIKVGTLVKK